MITLKLEPKEQPMHGSLFVHSQEGSMLCQLKKQVMK
jgi:hypothetical protein